MDAYFFSHIIAFFEHTFIAMILITPASLFTHSPKA